MKTTARPSPNQRWLFLISTIMLTLFSAAMASAQKKEQYVRLAKITVDSTQLESYKLALKEGIETAVKVEPGVLTLYAVADKNNPTIITVLEIYASVDAYKAHIETSHFKKYKSTTMNMVKALELVDVTTVAAGIKPAK